jgi:hypothetical protein
MKASIGDNPRRRAIRLFAASMAGVVSVLYLLIALNVVSVIELAPGEPSPQLYFGLPAALALLFGAVLLLLTDRRLLWMAGAVLQVLVIWMYFSVATTRVPMFETWGMLIRIAQVPLLIALGYLALTSPQHSMPTSHAAQVFQPDLPLGDRLRVWL